MALAKTLSAYSDIVEQYVTDASFLWVLRSVAAKQPHYNVADLRDLESRIQDQLDGLSMQPDLAWELILEALAFEESGEVFTAAVFAFRTMEVEKIKYVVSAGMVNDSTKLGLVSALAWLPLRLIESWLHKFYQSKDFAHKELALAVSSARREDPGEKLNRILARADCIALNSLHAQALRSAGELKRIDVRDSVINALKHEEPEVTFWALWSAIILGDRHLTENLEPHVLSPGPYQQIAIQLAFRVLPPQTARAWIGKFLELENSAQTRNGIKAMAALGDPEVINWLINTMRNPEFARVAAEAFTMITGIDLELHGLSLEVPDLEASLPEEDDDIPDLDEDENLPWPNVDKIVAIWQRYGPRFQSGKRYLMGKEICSANTDFFETNTRADRALREETPLFYQRQRHAAALEIALLSPNMPYLDADAKVLQL